MRLRGRFSAEPGDKLPFERELKSPETEGEKSTTGRAGTEPSVGC